MSEIKNGGLDLYGAEPFEQQQFGTAGVERINKNFISPRNGSKRETNVTTYCSYMRKRNKDK